MYALSSRVPEYGALLDAARRGVRIQILIDREVGQSILARLRAVREREGLPIEIRAGQRMMHQKYIVHPETHTVLTGTANLSTDASFRHSEQRILIRENPAITERFLADFDTIWARLPLSL
jgi:phosphatidylserine/phosphatidylglycerophosphate/cardiolipin synthase-like enzyme